MTIRVGINPITWTNDDMPELGGNTPLETCLSETKQAGYEGIELGGKFPREASRLKPILARHGLALISGWYSARLMERSVEQEMQAVESHLALLAAMGCAVMVFAETTGSIAGQRKVPLSHRPRMPEGDFAAYGRKLTELASRMAQRGVRMAYHHHMGTVIETEVEIDRLMRVTGPEVGLLLDTGHLTFAGGDPHAVLERHAARVNHVHCKDVREAVLKDVTARDASFLDSVLAGVFTVPGDGMVDFRRLALALKAMNYTGWVVVEAEQDPAKAHPLTFATMGHRNLSAALAA